MFWISRSSSWRRPRSGFGRRSARKPTTVFLYDLVTQQIGPDLRRQPVFQDVSTASNIVGANPAIQVAAALVRAPVRHDDAGATDLTLHQGREGITRRATQAPLYLAADLVANLCLPQVLPGLHRVPRLAIAAVDLGPAPRFLFLASFELEQRIGLI